MLNNIEVLSRVILEDAVSEAKSLLDNAKKEVACIERRSVQEIEKLKKNPKKNKIRMSLVCEKAKMILTHRKSGSISGKTIAMLNWLI